MTDPAATRTNANLNAQAVAEATADAVRARRAARFAPNQQSTQDAAQFAESDVANVLNAALRECRDPEFQAAFVAAFAREFDRALP